jgi:hypothetical protein
VIARAAIFAVAAAVSSVFFINFCGLVFQCGCTSLWAGADAHCNIHTPGAKHCPWCATGLGNTIWGVMVVVQAVLAFAFPKLRLPARAALALLAFPVVGAVAALVAGLASGYWAT